MRNAQFISNPAAAPIAQRIGVDRLDLVHDVTRPKSPTG
jgi:hypothetical protein